MSPEDVTNVGTVKANDLDEGNNAAVKYSITGQFHRQPKIHNYFMIIISFRL